MRPVRSTIRVAGAASRVHAAIAPWYDVCALDELPPLDAVRALVDGQPVLVVRGRDSVHALDLRFADGALAIRGEVVVLERDGAAIVVCPPARSFDARSGRCLERPDRRVAVHPCRVRAGRIEVGA